ncbi:hypothetical protein BDN72DRAFT_956714 [Pluteus cervinus]|uniref:Uncharacterized protein n=1 Tax=Pluteus cervinus TaxID=181527 RepID=A0ACD3B5I0_9AGAR|nr:hypothetical protein BDN72DRAFT_956714 [Pluteus cervinus]
MEPMNASPHHPKVKVTLGLGSPLFVAGAEVTGKMEVDCRADKGLGISVMMVELFAIQELSSRDHSATSTFLHTRRLFQGPNLPPSNAVQAHPLPGDPPLPTHYYTARRGVATFLFRIPIPFTSPPSINFASGLAKVRYEVRATVGVVWKGEKRLVTDKSEPEVVESYEVDFSRSEPEAIIVGEHGKIWAQGRIVGGIVVAGESACVELQVKNHSSRKNTGLTVSLIRQLQLPGALAGDKPVQLSDTLTTVPFRGPEYIIAPGMEGVASLVFDIPREARSLKGGTLKGDENKLTESLFEIRCYVSVKINMGLGSKDIQLDIPVTIVHTAALPELPPPEQYIPPVGYPYVAHAEPRVTPIGYADPPLGGYSHAPPHPHHIPPPMVAPYVDQNQVWLPPPIPISPHPQAAYAYIPIPILGQEYLHPQPMNPQYIPRPSSAGPVAQAQAYPSGLPITDSHQPFLPLGMPVSQVPAEPELGKGERASRIAHKLHSSTRHRSVSPKSHRYPLPVPPTSAGLAAAAPDLNAAPITAPAPIPSGGKPSFHLRNLPLPPPLNMENLSVSPPPVSPAAGTGLGGASGGVVHSPRPLLSPKHSFTVDPMTHASLPKSERVEELEHMAAEVNRKRANMSADIPKDDPILGLLAKDGEWDHKSAAEKVNKTLPGPPVPTKHLDNRKAPSAQSERPRADAYFANLVAENTGESGLAPPESRSPSKSALQLASSPSSPSPTKSKLKGKSTSAAAPIKMQNLPPSSSSADQSPVGPTDQTPPTPTLAAVRPKRDLLDVGGPDRTESGLDALERRLLAEVGTRKIDLGNKRPNAIDVLGISEIREESGGAKEKDVDRRRRSKFAQATQNPNGSGENGWQKAPPPPPVTIPIDIRRAKGDADAVNDSAISSLSLANHELDKQLGEREREREREANVGLGLALALDRERDRERDSDERTHRAGKSGDEDDDDRRARTRERDSGRDRGGRRRRKSGTEGDYEVDMDEDEEYQQIIGRRGLGRTGGGSSRKSDKAKDKEGDGERRSGKKDHKMKKAAGRVAAWLGGLGADVPPADDIPPPESPSVALGTGSRMLAFRPVSRSPSPVKISGLPSSSPVKSRPPSPLPVVTPTVRKGTSPNLPTSPTIASIPNPRSSGFVPIGTFKRDTFLRRPMDPNGTVVEEAKRVTAIWSSEASVRSAFAPVVSPGPSSPNRHDDKENDKTKKHPYPLTSPTPPKTQTIRTYKNVSPPSSPAPALRSPGGLGISFGGLVSESKQAVNALKDNLEVPARIKQFAQNFPVFSSSAKQDPEVKYDVRSARGGRGGKVTAVASLWAAGAVATPSGASPAVGPNKNVIPLPKVDEVKMRESVEPRKPVVQEVTVVKTKPLVPDKALKPPGLRSPVLENTPKSPFSGVSSPPPTSPSPQLIKSPSFARLANLPNLPKREEGPKKRESKEVPAWVLPPKPAPKGDSAMSTSPSKDRLKSPMMSPPMAKSKSYDSRPWSVGDYKQPADSVGKKVGVSAVGKVTAVAGLSSSKPSEPGPSGSNANGPIRNAGIHAMLKPSSRPLSSTSPAGSGATTPTTEKPKLAEPGAKRQRHVIKSPSVPAILSSSHATPMLSSTASLARPSPTFVLAAPPTATAPYRPISSLKDGGFQSFPAKEKRIPPPVAEKPPLPHLRPKPPVDKPLPIVGSNPLPATPMSPSTSSRSVGDIVAGFGKKKSGSAGLNGGFGSSSSAKPKSPVVTSPPPLTAQGIVPPPTPKSPVGDLAFGQARLRDLIKKYQG